MQTERTVRACKNIQSYKKLLTNQIQRGKFLKKRFGMKIIQLKKAGRLQDALPAFCILNSPNFEFYIFVIPNLFLNIQRMLCVAAAG